MNYLATYTDFINFGTPSIYELQKVKDFLDWFKDSKDERINVKLVHNDIFYYIDGSPEKSSFPMRYLKDYRLDILWRAVKIIKDTNDLDDKPEQVILEDSTRGLEFPSPTRQYLLLAKETNKCVCNIMSLMNVGCRCGGI